MATKPFPLAVGEGVTPLLPVAAHYAVYRVSDGMVLRQGTGQPAVITEQFIQPGAGEAVWISVGTPLPPDVYFQNGQPVPYTSSQVAARRAKPTAAIGWNNTAMSWDVDISALRIAKKRTIHKLGADATTRPIQVDGALWDADADARMAIMGKLQELALTDTYPELLLWRDAVNSMRVFESQAAMVAFLRRLIAAISKRETITKAKVWQRKSDLDAAADSALGAFDTSF